MPRGESKRRYYPGLVPREDAIWRAWLTQHEQDFEEFEYNVRCGTGVEAEPSNLPDDPALAEKVKEIWKLATQKKIDVVGRRGSEVWIFEVEDRPSTLALGQLLTYEALLPECRLVNGPITLAIVGTRIEPDALKVFENHGIMVWKVEL